MSAWPTTAAVSPLDGGDLLLVEDVSATQTKWSSLRDLSQYHSILVASFTATAPEAQPTADDTFVNVKWSPASIDTNSISGIASDSTKLITLTDANQDGMYQLYGEVSFSDAGAADKIIMVQIIISGSATGGAETSYATIDGATTRVSATCLSELESGDYVQIQVKQKTGSAGTLQGGICWAYKMGPA